METNLKSIMMRAGALAIATLTAVMSTAGATVAQEWPSKQVSIILPTAAGGSTDLMARLASEHLVA